MRLQQQHDAGLIGSSIAPGSMKQLAGLLQGEAQETVFVDRVKGAASVKPAAT